MVITRAIMKRCIKVIDKFITAQGNRIDPISLQRIKKKFSIVRCNTIHNYDAYILHEYITKTGDFCDPICRIDYNDCELMRLDKCVGKEYTFLIQNKKKLLQQRKIYNENISLTFVFESEIYMLIEDIAGTHEYLFDAKFDVEFLPQLLQCFDNFFSIDPSRCRIHFQSCIQRVGAMKMNGYLRYRLIHILTRLINYIDNNE